MMDYLEDERLNSSISPNIPDPNKNVVKGWKTPNGLELRLIENGYSLGANCVVNIPWALSILKANRYIIAISIERIDLRAVSAFTGEAVKLLSSEYGVKGYLTDANLVIYKGEEKEEVGKVSVSLKREEIERYLLDTALDLLDVADDELIAIDTFGGYV